MTTTLHEIASNVSADELYTIETGVELPVAPEPVKQSMARRAFALIEWGPAHNAEGAPSYESERIKNMRV